MSREPLSAEQKERFLELIASGMKRNEAAEQVGGTGSQFRALTKEHAPHYDPEFAIRYEEAIAEHVPNFQERVRTEYVRRAFEGSDKLLDTLGRVTLPEMEVLQTQRLEVSGQMLVGRYFDLTQLDRQEIETLTRILEKAQKKELPSGNGG